MTPAADVQLVSSEICSQQAIKEHTGRTEYTLVYTASYFGLEKTRFFKIRFSFMMVYWLKKNDLSMCTVNIQRCHDFVGVLGMGRRGFVGTRGCIET